MEGALPSVVGGLVAAPVIAVPTSVGYGASFGGVAALLACSIPALPTSPSSTLTTVSARRASLPASTGYEDFAPRPCEYLRLPRLSVVFFRRKLSLNQNHALATLSSLQVFARTRWLLAHPKEEMCA